MAGGFYLNFIQLTSIKVNRQKRQSCERSFKLASASLCGKQNRHKLPTHVFQMTAVLAAPKCSVLPATCVLASVRAVPSAGTVPFLLASMYLHDPAEVSLRLGSSPRAPPPRDLLCGARPLSPVMSGLSHCPTIVSLLFVSPLRLRFLQVGVLSVTQSLAWAALQKILAK